jgi:hypothetical protein
MIAPRTPTVKINFLIQIFSEKFQNDRDKKDHIINMEKLIWIHHYDWGGLFN